MEARITYILLYSVARDGVWLRKKTMIQEEIRERRDKSFLFSCFFPFYYGKTNMPLSSNKPEVLKDNYIPEIMCARATHVPLILLF